MDQNKPGMEEHKSPTFIEKENNYFDTSPLIEAGKALTQVLSVPEGFEPIVVTPKDAVIKRLDRVRTNKPRFLAAAPFFNDPVAFAEYINRFADQFSRIWYSIERMEFTCVLDYHQYPEGGNTAEARSGDHIAVLTLKQSPEWKIWKENNERAMVQKTFAEFLEDNSRDVVSPSIAEMLEVATGLNATSNATFRSAINQSNGTVNFQFDENVAGTVKGTDKAIPTAFRIGIRPFMGSERYPVECRLRYRLKDGSLVLHYKALHLDPIVEASVEGIAATLRDATTLPVALGHSNADVFKVGF
jgi:uncharacterized protein YfdQ (DUF2303 family)